MCIKKEYFFNTHLIYVIKMKKITTYTILSIFIGNMMISCHSEKSNGNNKNSETVEYLHPQISTVYDSIYTSLPGNMLVTDDYVAWTDPHSAENFLHIISKADKREVEAVGNIGSGPHDFATPFIDKGNKNEFVIYDYNLKKKANVLVDEFDHEGNGVVFENTVKLKNILRSRKLSDGCELVFSPNAKYPFGIIKDASVYYGGKYPIDNGELHADDKFNYFQGTIEYNDMNERILYSAYSFRYMALYERRGNKIQMIKETALPEYSIRDNRLKLGKNEIGVSEVAMTQNYIITAEYFDKDISSKDLKPNNYTLPESLCVYDYDLRLKKILKVDRPIMRISGHSNSDTIYAIVEDPDFKIVSITF